MVSKALQSLLFAACACLTSACVAQRATHAETEALATRSLAEIVAAIEAGDVSSADVTAAYIDRIERLDRDGPRINSVLVLNPDAMDEARAMDAELSSGIRRGPLHGAPILLKDNIEASGDMATTAGAFILQDNLTNRDAPVVAALRAAGAVILGKTNLSEWANFRSTSAISGWSAVGGQVRNPHMLDRSPCGSSSGSGAAIAMSFAAGALGTETNGSVICPAAMNGIVGFKPTVGLVSQDGIVPISPTQDTAGPMTRTVRDAALMLGAMSADAPDYASQLSPEALEGMRVGVLRFAVGDSAELSAVFEAALSTLQASGAELVDIVSYERPATLFDDEFNLLLSEFGPALAAYLGGSPAPLQARTLEELIAFNERETGREFALFGQEIFHAALAAPSLDDPAYINARERLLTATRADGIDNFLQAHDVAMLVSPSEPPAFLIDAIHGDSYPGGVGIGWMAAIAGYPHLTVPMGNVHGLPVGLSFISTAGEDARVLAAGYAYEVRRGELPAPLLLNTAADVPEIGAALAPP